MPLTPLRGGFLSARERAEREELVAVYGDRVLEDGRLVQVGDTVLARDPEMGETAGVVERISPDGQRLLVAERFRCSPETGWHTRRVEVALSSLVHAVRGSS